MSHSLSHSLLVQLWAGLFYLASKILRSVGDRSESPKVWRMMSPVACLIGLPAWVGIFAYEHSWIAAALAVGSVSGLVVTLTTAARDGSSLRKPKWTMGVMVIAMFIGLGYSLYSLHGVSTWGQLIELAMSAGFFVGTVGLTRRRIHRYLLLVLMHASVIALVWVEGYPVLAMLQTVSLCFIIDGYATAQKYKIKA